jgi:hypothetical protein
MAFTTGIGLPPLRRQASVADPLPVDFLDPETRSPIFSWTHRQLFPAADEAPTEVVDQAEPRAKLHLPLGVVGSARRTLLPRLSACPAWKPWAFVVGEGL